MSLQSPPSDYRPIRRIARACQNCRRKKAKCSGERPICRNCRRLSQVCKYGDADATQPKDNQESDQNCPSPSIPDEQQGGIPYDQLANRIVALEGKIDQLVTTIHSFLPLLQTVASSPLVLPRATSIFEDRRTTYVGRDINQQDQFQTAQNKTSFDKLPPADVALALIDVYFSSVHNQPYSFFHEQDFRQRYADGLIPDYLTFAILASSLRFAKHPYFNHKQQEVTMVYASSSWNHIVNVWFATESEPNLHVCQTVTLLSIIDFTGGRRHPGWMKIGLAIRVAQDLGLMLEPSDELSIIDQEERRKVFWSIYVLDKLCSCGKARPAAIPDAQCHVQLPGREVDSRHSNGQRVQTLKQAFSSVDGHDGFQSHSSLVVLTASIIGKCAQHMIHDQGRGEDGLPPWDSKSDFAKINSTLLQLETQFEIGNSIEDAILTAKYSNGAGYDMQVAGPIIFSYALFYTSQCLINHPFLLYQQSKSTDMKPPASFLSRALESGRENACLMAKLLKDTEALGCPVFYSYFGYCTTVCASIHTMYINDPNVERQQQARQCLHTQKAFLEQYALVWRIGKHMLSIIDKLALHQSIIPTTCPTSLRFELLDSEELVDLWAAVDYTTMTQEPKGAARTSLGKSPNWDTVFNANMNEFAALTSLDSQRQESVDQIHDESAAHSDLMPPGTSPFSSIFYDTSMNFGA